jgi:hypothetical protein
MADYDYDYEKDIVNGATICKNNHHPHFVPVISRFDFKKVIASSVLNRWRSRFVLDDGRVYFETVLFTYDLGSGFEFGELPHLDWPTSISPEKWCEKEAEFLVHAATSFHYRDQFGRTTNILGGATDLSASVRYWPGFEYELSEEERAKFVNKIPLDVLGEGEKLEDCKK